MNEILNAIATRHSIRSFEPTPLPQEALEAITRAAIEAPTAMDRQLWQFTVITDDAKIQSLARAIAHELNRDEGYCFYRPAALIITSNERDNPHAAEDNACALENIFLAAHSLGIGSVWINQMKGICDQPAIRAELQKLGVPDSHLVFGMAALGYPAAPPKEKVRRADAVKWVK